MPSRKVRRRRQKLQRHEYEYVVETEEGEEIPLERPTEREKGTDERAGKVSGPIAGVGDVRTKTEAIARREVARRSHRRDSRTHVLGSMDASHLASHPFGSSLQAL
jgi:hypothetical protein